MSDQNKTIDKVDAILRKLTITNQVEIWQAIEQKINQRISENQNQLTNLQNKLSKKETE